MESGKQISRTLPDTPRGSVADPEAEGVDALRPVEVAEPGIPGVMRLPLWWADDAAVARLDVSPYAPQAEEPLPDADSPPDAAEVPSEPQTFAWSFDDVEEVRARPSAGRGLALIAVGVVCIVSLVAVAVFAGGEDKKSTTAATPPPVAAPQEAPLGPPESHMPRGLTLGGFDGRVQVTWQPPERADQVVGFMAIAQSRQGAVLGHQLLPATETSAVFTSPPMTRDGCIVVATLVRGGSGVTPVRSEPVCL
ncbi:MAG TPA: hypothetical protein VLH10_28060 [Yinghuangia sp.]|uniref:hypothetical protein n=1 Tax=Yinghuangia sp. YIM S10712 TaxID=3436930 RepID=UPI002C2F3AD3|nr:hypothetical protein [Yinghuangia sp.]